MASANEAAAGPRPPRVLGRYLVFEEIGVGGMASVHLARHVGPLGFRRTVAVKRLHPQLAKNPEFVAMFVDEARLAARVQHPNVVATIDVVSAPEELFLVMDYVHGETLARLLRGSVDRLERVAPPLAAAIVRDALHGLHAAHEARDEQNRPLSIVHRDVSPQNILVGIDGIARMLDFGVAKASSRSQITRDGQVKGKLGYMAPEQIRGRPVDRRADVFASAVVLWELLTGERLFDFDDAGAAVHHILNEVPHAPSKTGAGVSAALDEVVLRGLERDPAARFATAREMAAALEAACAPAGATEVGRWVESIAGRALADRRSHIVELEGMPAEVAEREVTRVAAQGSTVRSVLREIAERDARAEAPTDVGDLEVARASPPAPSRPPGSEPRAATEAPAAPLARDERPAARGVPRWLVALGATLVGAALAVALMRAVPSAPARAPDAEPRPAASVPQEPAETGAAQPASSVADDVPEPEPVAPSVTVHAPAHRPVAPSAPRTASGPAPARSTADCSPAYYFQDGIKRYKPQCFGPR